MSPGGQTGGGPDRAPERVPYRLWDHIGVISGVVLGVMVFGFLVVLAFAGVQAALAIVVVAVVGIAFIVLGGRMRGGSGRL